MNKEKKWMEQEKRLELEDKGWKQTG